MVVHVVCTCRTPQFASAHHIRGALCTMFTTQQRSCNAIFGVQKAGACDRCPVSHAGRGPGMWRRRHLALKFRP